LTVVKLPFARHTFGRAVKSQSTVATSRELGVGHRRGRAPRRQAQDWRELFFIPGRHLVV